MIKKRIIFSQIQPHLHSLEAIVITGMRRTGKTTTLKFFYNKISSQNKIFLDMENPLNRKFFEEINYEKIRSTFEVLGLNFSKKAFIFIDEIQFVKNIPSVVKYFIDHYNVKFFLTGSASFYLKHLFSESLSGRKYIFEIFPLTFKEFLWFKNNPLKLPKVTGNIPESIIDIVTNLYDEYIRFGGFPGVVLKTSVKEKRKALEEIFSSFFQLEVLQLGDFRRNNVVRDLILLLMQRVGSKLDIQKLSRELGISRPTLYEYLSFLEDTYFIKRIRPFSRSKDTEIRKMPKVYICDSGLIYHFGNADEGSLFENSVFQNLRMQGEVNYYQRKSGREIDFIFNKKTAIEVKVSPTRKDMQNLKELASALNLQDYKIVSKQYSTLKNVVYGFML